MHEEITKAAWRKASYCNGATACVEVAPLPDGGVALRDSKQPDGPVLTFTGQEWWAFQRGVLAGEFDTVAFAADARTRGAGVAVAGVEPSEVSR